MNSAKIRPVASLLLTALISALLISCEPVTEGDKPFDTYQKRVSSVLEVEAPGAPVTSAIRLPEKRDLRKPVPRVSMGIVESYGFNNCGLFNVIAEKNSVLGKVQDEFANLDYQVKLLNTLRTCMESEALDIKQQQALKEIERVKSQHFSLHWHNFITQSDEIRGQFTSGGWLPREEPGLASEVSLGFLAIAQVKRNYRASYAGEIRSYQEAIEKTPVAGPLIYSLRRSTQWLDQITAVLNANKDKVVCEANRSRETYTYLSNVFDLFFVKEIHPYLSVIDRTYYVLGPYLNDVTEAYGNDPALDLGLIHGEYRRAVRDHVLFWKGVFEKCDRMLGATSEVH